MVGELYVSCVLPFGLHREPTIYFRMGCNWAFTLMPYGDLWRTHRRLFHHFFNLSATSQFDDKIHNAMNVFLRRLSESPDRFLRHVHLYACPHSTAALSQAHYTPYDREALPGH